MTKLYAAVAAAAVAGLLGGSALYIVLQQKDDAFAQCRGGQVGGGDIGGPFTLVDETGATVTDAEVLTKPSLIYFGYTFCPDICPLDAARNAEAVDILEEWGVDVTPIFISVDPERDTPEVLATFTEYMHPKMLGLTGSPEQVRQASLAYKTFYRKQEGDADYYLVDHSTFTYLTLPGIGFVDFFRREETADQIAERVACFATNAPAGGKN
ncbi:SCO family protein [Pseudorhodobacter sp. MZDSW-24AT]|uniref:SCO family protein n=1 Tax=Pseudorhodobacter sp. MZDSW-24AT TaxID=2052957 RepID=UPI000C1E9424|nr:SCO family protein [Pseudorhodobacter sp. MZDSW-24AT]PJF09962.1 SCO family protein [Pseudorhodobacter sp. MZDSW-24AT]